MQRTIRTLASALVFLFAVTSTGLADSDSANARIDEVLRDFYSQGKFNGVVLAADDGRVVYHKAFGQASANGDEALRPDSVFRLASVAKGFTGLAVVLLRDAGQLTLTDDVRMHIPEFPYAGVTIQHLLEHTSGLPDYVTLLEQHWDVDNKDNPAQRKIARSPDALRMLVQHRPDAHFAPGERWEYSNTGYVMLGLIVERVSGKSFGQFLKQRIFKPLGMNDTVLFNPKRPPTMTHQAFGFMRSGKNITPNDQHFLNGMYGDGEVYSTATDLLKWDQSLYTDKLLVKKSRQDIFTSGRLLDGKETGYGWGWQVSEEYGHRVVSHGGGWVGFRTWIQRDMDAKRTLIVLTNDTSRYIDELKAALQQIVFESPELIESHSRQVPWSASRVTGRPQPPLPYRSEVAFPHLQFNEPLTITNAPNSSRLFVVQRAGEVVSFPEDAECDSTDIMVDLRDFIPNVAAAYGMTFHPRFPDVPYVYICYVLKGNDPDGSVISRFTVDQFDPPRVSPNSELRLLRWLAGGHNGCSLKFGPDGYLYISTGDGTGPNPPDTLRAGQDLSNLLSAILRIDVDRTQGELNYAIPPDNPFVDLDGARPEIYAFGFRNPWKMSFDRQTGDLWVGDVGWDTWELVFRVQRGGNYGWSVVEGSNPILTKQKRGPGPILPPVIEHHHSEARSITGGFVYYGKKHADLVGCYVYGDYNTGKIWALRYEDQQVQEVRELTNTPHQIVGWAETNDGELYYADYQRSNRIYQLVPNEAEDRSRDFPRRLSETGLFSSLLNLTPASGVEPYDINAPVWADGARAIRHLALPDDSQIQTDNDGKWRFPPDTVIVRTVVKRFGGVERRLETQMLHLDGTEWRPYSYVWNKSQDEAELAPVSGSRVSIGDQEYQVSSRVECRICHTKPMGVVLGLNLRQLTSATPRNDGLLQRWGTSGVLARLPSPSWPQLPPLVDPYDEDVDVSQRVRSYLHVNCVSCHRPGGGGPSPIHLDFDQSLQATKLVNEKPVQGDFQLPDARIVVPGDPLRSVLFYRMAKIGPGHMPHIGAKDVDEAGLRLIHAWISGLDNRPLEKLDQAAIDLLLESSQGTLKLAWLMRSKAFSDDDRSLVVHRALASARPHVRDLLEPFYPEEHKQRRLGTNFDDALVLDLAGDASRGLAVFKTESLQCVACHKVSGEGGDLGPALDEIAKKYMDARGMLDTIVRPSAKIDAAYQTQVIVTTAGEVLTGRVMQQSETDLTLMTVDRKMRRLRKDELEQITTGEKSLMPEQLLHSLTAQEAADLIAYLLSLR